MVKIYYNSKNRRACKIVYHDKQLIPGVNYTVIFGFIKGDTFTLSQQVKTREYKLQKPMEARAIKYLKVGFWERLENYTWKGKLKDDG
jgi:hypothetical protein